MTSRYPLTLRGFLHALAPWQPDTPGGTPPVSAPSRVLRGVTTASIIEVMLVVGLISVLSMGYMATEKKANEKLRWGTMADQLTLVSNAAKQYIQDNEDTLLQNVTSGHPQTISAKTLQDDGYIPSGFGLTNASHQGYEVDVALNPKQSGHLEAFVLTTGGVDIPFDGMRSISADAGGMAGYVENTSVATGAYGGWSVQLTDYGITASTGHLVSYLSSDVLGSNDEASDRLYRYTVTNRPDLNTMHTAINMDGNNINNGGTINTAAVTASGALQSDSVTTNTLTANTSVNTSTLTASNSITTNALTANNSINTNALYANGITTYGNVSATGTVTANGTITGGGTVRANGRLSAGEYLQLDKVATAGTACSPNGLVSRDSNGAILSCQSGVWAGMGGAGLQAPPAQIISCNDTANTYYGKVDSNGQLWVSFDNSNWTKGVQATRTNRYDSYVSDYVGVGLDGVSGSGMNSKYQMSNCNAYWKW
ncbi:shufflon system plasmid conjugative transfer pilus tip adhesin PilV [Salmonella enterica subsp. enterica]|nr:shufflon system plasmid conjugative transfer pilus tip adhesin PilV [Salmonella enterica subsp. enterica serovar Menston]